MRVTRHRRGLVAATFTLTLLGLSAGPAAAADSGVAELFPNPARPGDAVAVNTAQCVGDTSATGDATTVGGGTFQLEPSTHPEVLIGQFTVPMDTSAGDYGISVECAGGDVAVGTLRVVESGSTSNPTGTPTQAGAPTGTASASATAPSGGVSGGVGGPGSSNAVLIAGSTAALIAVGAGGAWVLHRRNSGGDH